MSIASLSSIGQVVPVYLNLNFSSNNDPDQGLVSIPATPNAPDNLTGEFDANNVSATLSWQDNSDNETVMIVRRRPSAGLWETAENLSSNTTNYSQGLPTTGEFEYKVIAVNGSIPSAPSNSATVTVTNVNPEVVGQAIYEESLSLIHI